MNQEFDYINTLERLAKSNNLRGGNINKYTKEILKESAIVLGCERTNAWVFNKNGKVLESLDAYFSSSDNYKIESSLTEELLPNYFHHLKRGEIIVSNEAHKAPINAELISMYIKANSITSMIDVPIRSEGKMIGVICFEHVGICHNWTIEEQKFTQSISQLFSLALETNKKRIYAEKLEKIIKEKEILMAEVNHRVKNNMASIISLLRLQKMNCTDDYSKTLFNEVINKVYTMSAIQDRLHLSQDFSEINIKDYVVDLISNLKNSYSLKNEVLLAIDIDDLKLDLTKSVPFGLIINEIATNSFKYGFIESNLHPKLSIRCRCDKDFVRIEIEDNGPGMEHSKNENTGMGLELVQNLSNQIGGVMTHSLQDGMKFSLTFCKTI